MGVVHDCPTILHCDNCSAIEIAHNDVYHECTKHIETDCHFIHGEIIRRMVHLQHILFGDQTTDIFTKSHPFDRFRELYQTQVVILCDYLSLWGSVSIIILIIMAYNLVYIMVYNLGFIMVYNLVYNMVYNLVWELCQLGDQWLIVSRWFIVFRHLDHSLFLGFYCFILLLLSPRV